MSDPVGPHTITLVTPGEELKHGQRGEPTRTVVEGCMVYPRGSTEEQGRSATVITGKTALAPAGTVVRPEMQVEFNGLTYDVVGDVGDWDFMDGDGAAVQINLERASN